MTGDSDSAGLEPLAAVRADAARLDALAAGAPSHDEDPALLLLAALRGEIDAAVASTDTPSLRRDAALLDALAAGGGLPPSADPAVALLQALRAAVDGVTVPPAIRAPAIGTPAPAVLPLAAPAGIADRAGRGRRRALRTGVAAGSVALALSMSGVAAAAYDSHPGGALYGLRAQTFGRTADDPVAAEQVLGDLQKQAAVAVSSPGDTAAAAEARADVSRLQHYLSAEHNPVARESIAAAAMSVTSAVEALPAPVVRSRSPRPSASALAGLPSSAVHPTLTGASPTSVAVLPVPPAPTPTPHEPDASPGSIATPSPTDSADPTGTPLTTDSPTDTPSSSPGPSSTDSGDPTASPSGSPSDAASASASTSPTDSPSATVKTPPVTRSPLALKTGRPKVKTVKKKRVTATLMTAQLPSSGLPQR